MSTHAPCLGPPLEAWLNRLDREGFQVGIRERLLVQTLFAGLAAEGELDETSSLEEMLRLAGPLVCSQPEQQRKYASLLRDFVREIGDDKAKGPDVGSRSPSKASKSRLWPAAFAEIFAYAIGFKLWWLITLPCPPSSIISIPLPAAPTAQIVSPAASVYESSITDAKPPIPNIQAPIAISDNTYAVPVQPAQPWTVTSWIILLVGWTIITSFAWLTWAGWRRKRYLQDVRTDEQVEEDFLSDPNPIKIEPSPEVVRLASRTMRQRYTGDHLVLDIPATLRATMLAGNALALRYRSTTLTP